jgi:hypothetical protein
MSDISSIQPATEGDLMHDSDHVAAEFASSSVACQDVCQMELDVWLKI